MHDELAQRGIPFAVGGLGFMVHLDGLRVVARLCRDHGIPYETLWETKDLAEYEKNLAAGTVHRAEYKVGTMCAVPPGPHWHQHFSTDKTEPLRYLAIVPRGDYEQAPAAAAPEKK